MLWLLLQLVRSHVVPISLMEQSPLSGSEAVGLVAHEFFTI
jgi:hypothetical protein